MNIKYFKKYILTLLTMPAISLSAIAGVDYDAGMNAYNKGDYAFAKILFQKALKVNYYDVNARYMYCQILSKEKKYDEAKKEYQTIIKIAPSSQAATLSKQGIANIDVYNKKLLENNNSPVAKTQNNTSTAQNNEKQETATEYLKNAYRGGNKYLRQRGIVRVYIEPDSKYKPMVQRAYSEWQSAIGSYLSFSYSGNKQDATDIVTFTKNNGDKGMQEGGHCEYNIQGNTLAGNKIVIRAYGTDGKALPDNMVYHTILHEIGHSLGIMGHSPYKNDIMSQGVSTFLPHLSARDKNTIKLLYRNYGKEPEKKDIQKAKTAELTDIAKRIPNDPGSLIDLGDEAMSAGDYEKAVSFYKKAENIRQNSDIYYRQIKAYTSLKDNDNIIICYKKILQVDKSNKTALNNLLAIYQQQRRYEDGKNVLTSFIEKNPNLANDSQIQQFKQIFSDANIKKMQAREKFINRTTQYGYR
ncbi:tetratricopeptide repeat protein [bacterium]|nr:tetratricopeptide repeat protein [bacterium]